MIDINELEARCDMLIKIGHGNSTACDARESKEIITRLRQAEKDASRYRWMRDGGLLGETGDVMDAALDKAMK